MQFAQGVWDHLVYENNLDIPFPDRCGKFFKLSIKDRETVLNDTGFCPTCAIETKHHKEPSCQQVWERNKARGSNTVKCRAENCFKHWAMCPQHRDHPKEYKRTQ